MTRESFEKRHAPTWEAFETLVSSLEPRVGGPADADATDQVLLDPFLSDQFR